MRLTTRQGSILQAVNAQQVQALRATDPESSVVWDAILLMAEMVDEVCDGSGAYMTVGATTRKDAICITVHLGTEKQSLYSDSLLGALAQLSDLL